MRKFFAVVGILLIILSILISCAPEPSVLFDNFMNDLDVEGRYSDYAAEIGRGKSSDIIVNAIDALIEDLNTMTLDNTTAKEITAMFLAACDDLKSAAKLDMKGADSDSKDKLKESDERFQQAVKKEYSFSKKQ
jgi:hypothetical protein